jgi:hypothetical protein
VKHDLVNVFAKDVNALIVELFLVFFVLLGRRVGFWFCGFWLIWRGCLLRPGGQK